MTPEQGYQTSIRLPLDIFAPEHNELHVDGLQPSTNYDIDDHLLGNDDHGNVYFLWRESMITQPFLASTSHKVMFRRSVNDGDKFSGPPTLIATAPEGSEFSSLRMCNDNQGHGYVIWIETVGDLFSGEEFNQNLFLSSSSDYGTNWSPKQRVDHALTNKRIYTPPSTSLPQIHCDDQGHVYVFWEDNRNGLARTLFFNSSSDYGVSWQSEDIVIGDSNAVPKYVGSPQVCTDENGHLYLAWKAMTQANQVRLFFNQSSDYGSSWQPTPTRIDHNHTDIYYPIQDYSLSCNHQGGVYVAWHGNSGSFSYHTYLNRSLDGGRTWQTSDRQIDNNEDFLPNVNLTFKANNNHLYLLWQTIPSLSAASRLIINYSLNNGINWSPSNTRIDNATNQSPIYQAKLNLNNQDDLYVVWEQNNTIQYNFSTDQGLTWSGPDKVNSAPDNTNQSKPNVIVNEKGVAVVGWQDDRYSYNVPYDTQTSFFSIQLGKNCSSSPTLGRWDTNFTSSDLPPCSIQEREGCLPGTYGHGQWGEYPNTNVGSKLYKTDECLIPHQPIKPLACLWNTQTRNGWCEKEGGGQAWWQELNSDYLDDEHFHWSGSLASCSSRGEEAPWGNISYCLEEEELSLKQGWNLISFQLRPTDDQGKDANIDKILKTGFGIGERYQTLEEILVVVLSFDQGALSFYPDLPSVVNTLQTMDAYHGYWIKVKDDAVFKIKGAPNYPRSFDLNTGWNLIGYLGDEEKNPADYLSKIIDKTEIVLGFDANLCQGGNPYDPRCTFVFDPQAEPYVNNLSFKPYLGYWIKMKSGSRLEVGE